MMRQKVFPLPTVGAPTASNSPSALSAHALRARALDYKKESFVKYSLFYHLCALNIFVLHLHWIYPERYSFFILRQNFQKKLPRKFFVNFSLQVSMFSSDSSEKENFKFPTKLGS